MHMRSWIAAAAALAATALGVYLLNRRPSPESLLRLAYQESRPFAARWAGAAHAPLRQTRAPGGSLDKSRALLEAEARIGVPDLDRMSGLRLKGQLDLLNGRWDDAVAAFERALDLSPDDSTLWLELANAYLTRGDRLERPLDHALAMNLYARAAQKMPQSLEARFNLAYTFERFHLWPDARDAWTAYLEKDPASPWAHEARERRRFAESILDRRRQLRDRLVKDPAAFLRLSPEEADTEQQLNVAIEEWLPRRTETVSAQALARLARLTETRHRDRWLTDYLAAPASPELDQALIQLLRASRRADPAAGKRASLEVTTLAQRSANRAARLRALGEEAYALQWSREADRCISVAQAASVEARAASYIWIHWQTRLQKSICASIAARMSEAVAETEAGAAGIAASGYAALALRWRGIDLSQKRQLGSNLLVWRQATDAMRDFWRLPLDTLRLVQFPHELSRAAAQLDLNWTSYYLSRAAAEAQSASGRERQEAGQRARLVDLAARLGDQAESRRQLARAEVLFRALGNDPAVVPIRNYQRVSNAERELLNAQPARALEILRDLVPDDSLRFDYWRIRGAAQLATGDLDEAHRSLHLAASLHRNNMSTRLAAPDALEAHNAGRALHRDLLAVLWARQQPAAAVEAWEAFQGELAPPQQIVRPRDLTTATLLGWILRPDGLYSWIADDRLSTQKRLSVDPAALRLAIRRLQRACADPRRSADSLEADTAFLRHSLLDPWRPHLDPDRVLLIEADGELANIPWAVLLGSRRAATMLDGLRHWSPAEDGRAFSRRSRAVILAAPSLAPDLLPLFPPLAAAREEGVSVAALFHQSALYEGREATFANLAAGVPQAEIFHFAGHGFANAGNGGLMLAPDETLDARRLRGLSWKQCRLAVLSACTTGVGEHRGPVNPESLARALLDSGVRRVLASRWAVDSETTRLLIEAFYRELLLGVPPARALAAAAQHVSQQPGRAHPYYWAGFQLYGQP